MEIFGGDEGDWTPELYRTPDLPLKDMKLLNNLLSRLEGGDTSFQKKCD